MASPGAIISMKKRLCEELKLGLYDLPIDSNDATMFFPRIFFMISIF